MDIQINRFKDYKVVNNPISSQMIDRSINEEWWNNEGWSSMYGMNIPEFKKKLPNWDKDISSLAFLLKLKKPNKITDKLQGVFDFLEKKENKENPLKIGEEANKIFSEPKALYAGKIGFGYINNGGNVEIFSYPASFEAMEEENKIKFYITEVKDGGIVVWDNNLEQEQGKFDEII